VVFAKAPKLALIECETGNAVLLGNHRLRAVWIPWFIWRTSRLVGGVIGADRCCICVKSGAQAKPGHPVTALPDLVIAVNQHKSRVCIG